MNIVRKLYTSYLASKRDAFVFNSLSCEEGQGGRLGGGLRWGLYYYRECFSPRILPVCVCLWLTVIVVMYLHPGSNICICELPFKGTEHLQCVTGSDVNTHISRQSLNSFGYFTCGLSLCFSLLCFRWFEVGGAQFQNSSLWTNQYIAIFESNCGANCQAVCLYCQLWSKHTNPDVKSRLAEFLSIKP